MLDTMRTWLWRLLGISRQHIGWTVDNPYLKEDIYTTIGYKSYDNNAVVYRWSKAPLVIGRYCSISYGVKFVMDDGCHTYNQVSNYPFRTNRVTGKQGITVGNDVWIGLNVTLLPGVKIGNGVTIAAGSVVIEDVPDYCVVAGVPAKVVKEKCSRVDAARMNSIAWWNWSEDLISSRIDDFKLPIHEFLEKYAYA